MQRIIEATKSTINRLEWKIKHQQIKFPDSELAKARIAGLQEGLRLAKLDLELQEIIINGKQQR